MSPEVDQAFVRRMREQLDQELRKKEREVIDYWRGELDKLLKKPRPDLPSLLNDLKALSERMARRLGKI